MNRVVRLVFDFMDRDTVCTHVEADFETGVVTAIDYTDIVVKTVFGKNEKTIDNLLDFFEERCFERTRPDAYELAKYLGVNGYNPMEICFKTHGKLWDDFQWIRFEGETFDWDYIKDK